MTLNAHFDGKTIVLDEPVSPPLKVGERLRLNIETVEESPSPVHAPGGFRALDIRITPGLSNAIALDPELGVEEF